MVAMQTDAGLFASVCLSSWSLASIKFGLDVEYAMDD